MRILFKLFPVLIFLCFSIAARAQDTFDIAGTVYDEKMQPVQNVTIFISGSDRLVQTDNAGNFQFKNISAGTYQLAVRMLGYNALTHNVIVAGNSSPLHIQLSVKPIQIEQVVIGKKKAIEKNLQLFKDKFLGRSANGKECVITNPGIINFSTKKGLLLADADDFLIIENKRLGYRIHYLLQSFGYNAADNITLYNGEVHFEELQGTADQLKQWKENRASTYKGSLMHFLRSVYNNTTLAEGFLVREMYRYGQLNTAPGYETTSNVVVNNRSFNFKDVVKPTGDNLVELTFPQLYIQYDPSTARSFANYHYDQKRSLQTTGKSSVLKLSNNKALVDIKGSYTNYRDFFIQGAWANARVSDQLPIDYVLGN